MHHRISFAESVAEEAKDAIVEKLLEYGNQHDIPFRFGAMTCELDPAEFAAMKQTFANELYLSPPVQEIPCVYKPIDWVMYDERLMKYGLEHSVIPVSASAFYREFAILFAINGGYGHLDYDIAQIPDIQTAFVKYFAVIEELAGVPMTVPTSQSTMMAGMVPAYIAYYTYGKNTHKNDVYIWNYNLFSFTNDEESSNDKDAK